ncbi:hypothetical protein SAMN05421505_112182 [Sinosporangium album]|uniref:Uncharacterized protein n=1 Tax=Sinosporangium album TaxID=504805 RepID=A0A1G8AIT0_9ACTN|nr:hypothetical protein SAMN05421505_112182 [Sinosporangium album]
MDHFGYDMGYGVRHGTLPPRLTHRGPAPLGSGYGFPVFLDAYLPISKRCRVTDFAARAARESSKPTPGPTALRAHSRAFILSSGTPLHIP